MEVARQSVRDTSTAHASSHAKTTVSKQTPFASPFYPPVLLGTRTFRVPVPLPSFGALRRHRRHRRHTTRGRTHQNIHTERKNGVRIRKGKSTKEGDHDRHGGRKTGGRGSPTVQRQWKQGDEKARDIGRRECDSAL